VVKIIDVAKYAANPKLSTEGNLYTLFTNKGLNLGTCEASRFDLNSNQPFRFDSKVMGRFENF